MARKKLNKKVAIIGLVFLLIIGLFAGYVFYQKVLNRNPAKFLRKAQEALAQKDYEQAEKNYSRAFGCADNDQAKLDILNKLVAFHLINDGKAHEPNWRQALGCWLKMVAIDPKNTEARRHVLNYFYELGAAGGNDAWKEVEERAGELIRVMEGQNVAVDAWVVLAKARATYELARMGQKTDRNAAINEAISGFEKVRELKPADAEIYGYISQAILFKGQMENAAGSPDALEKSQEQAEAVLTQGVKASPDNPRAYVNLIQMKQQTVLSDQDKLAGIEKEYDELLKKFPQSDEVYAALSGYYEGVNRIDKAIEAMSKARSLSSRNITYAIGQSLEYYRKASVEKDQQMLLKAIEIAEKSLELPEAQDIAGPRQIVQKTNRFILLTQLCTYYLEEVFGSVGAGSENQKKEWLDKATNAFNQAKQLTGSAIYELKWNGILAFAAGDKTTAVQQMYKAYEQMRATGDNDAYLAYHLNKIFEGTSEIGARKEFLESALAARIAVLKPETLLEYGQILLQLQRQWEWAVTVAKIYEKEYPSSDLSKKVLVSGYIGSGQFEEAQSEISKLDANSSLAIDLKLSLIQAKIIEILRTEANQNKTPSGQPGQPAGTGSREQLEKLYREFVQLTEKLMTTGTGQVDTDRVTSVCDWYVEQGQTGKAKELADRFSSLKPDDFTIRIYRQTLDEPNPQEVSRGRRFQIIEQQLMSIPDELKRRISLGQFYLTRQITEEEIRELRKEAKTEKQLQDAVQKKTASFAEQAMTEFSKAMELSPESLDVIEGLFESAIQANDWSTAERMLNKARKLNTDQCQGHFFAARLALVRDDKETALTELNRALDLRPVFSNGYYLRSIVNDMLRRYEEAILDARKAYSSNPLNGSFAKQLAVVFNERHLRLGQNALPEQKAEAERALLEAIKLNPNEWQLRSSYAEFISNDQPERALAIMQELAKNVPNTYNNLRLGNIAMNMGRKELDTQRRKVLFDIAGVAFENAYRFDPEDKTVLSTYSEFLRQTDQDDKAVEILTGQKDVLWQYYLRNGQYDKAKQLLEKLHAEKPDDIYIVRGLIIVAQKTQDTAGIEKYTDKLLSIDKSTENELIQIQAYLEVGMTKQATAKLASFIEKNPGNPSAIMLDAFAMFRSGKMKEALDRTSRALELAPENPNGWRLRGLVNRYLGNLRQAVDDLRKARSLGADPIVYLDIANTYKQLGQTEEAIGELNAALKIQDTPAGTWTMLEAIYQSSNRTAELQKLYEMVLKKYPDDYTWYYKFGLFAMRQKNYAAAEEHLKRAWQLSEAAAGGGDAAVLDWYLESLMSAGKYQEMLNYAAKYTDTDLAPIAYAQMAQTYLKLGNRPRAIEYYRTAMEKSGTNNELIYAILGNMSKTVGIGEVTTWCNERLQADGNNLAANFAMFNVMLQQEQTNKALEYLNKCIGLVEKKSRLWTNLLFNKVNVLTAGYLKTQDQNYLDEAVRSYQSLLEVIPDNPAVLNNLAYLLADNNQQIDKALDYAAKAYEAAPDDPSRMDTYAYALCRNGKYDKAMELVSRAIQMYELRNQAVSWDVLTHLGMAQEGLGEKSAALASYKRALDAAGKDVPEKNMRRIEEAINRLK